MEFKAAVLHEVGGPLAIERIEAGPLKATDVLVRLKASGLCATPTSKRSTASSSIHSPSCPVTRRRAWSRPWARRCDWSTPGDHVVCSWNPTIVVIAFIATGISRSCASRSPPTSRAGVLLDGESRLSVERRAAAPFHDGLRLSPNIAWCPNRAPFRSPTTSPSIARA